MKRETPTGLVIIEKISGLLIIILGIIVFYYTRQLHGLESIGYALFIFFGLVLIALGLFITLVKSQ